MSTISVARTSSLPQATVFAVVADVLSYPQFLSWCSALSLVDSEIVDAHTKVLTVDMAMRLALLQAQARCEVRIDRAAGLVAARHLSGMLQGGTISWHVRAVDGGSEVKFNADLPLSGLGKRAVANAIAAQVAASSVAAFERRALQRHLHAAPGDVAARFAQDSSAPSALKPPAGKVSVTRQV